MKPKIAALLRELIVQAILNRTELSYVQIAEEHGVSEWMVSKIAREDKICRKRGAGSRAFWRGLR